MLFITKAKIAAGVALAIALSAGAGAIILSAATAPSKRTVSVAPAAKEFPKLAPFDFDPAFDTRPIGPDFTPGVCDPLESFMPKERLIADRLAEEGWRIDARPENHTQYRRKNPDVMVRKGGDRAGVIIEFKTPESGSSNAVKRNMHEASKQAGEVVIDGRPVGVTEDVARRSFRRECGQPGKSAAAVIHVILGDGRMVTFRKGQ